MITFKQHFLYILPRPLSLNISSFFVISYLRMSLTSATLLSGTIWDWPGLIWFYLGTLLVLPWTGLVPLHLTLSYLGIGLVPLLFILSYLGLAWSHFTSPCPTMGLAWSHFTSPCPTWDWPGPTSIYLVLPETGLVPLLFTLSYLGLA